jgi:hypothetical protein
MQILHFLCITPLDCIHGVRRTNSQFASACASCIHEGVIDTGKANVYAMIFFDILLQSFQCPLMRVSIQFLILVRCLLQHCIPLFFSPVSYLRWTTSGFIRSKLLELTFVIVMDVVSDGSFTKVKHFAEFLYGFLGSRDSDNFQANIPFYHGYLIF